MMIRCILTELLMRKQVQQFCKGISDYVGSLAIFDQRSECVNWFQLGFLHCHLIWVKWFHMASDLKVYIFQKLWSYTCTFALLNSADVSETLLKNILLGELMTAFAKFQRHWLKLIRYSTLKSLFIFAKIYFKTYMCRLLFISLNRESKPKCLQCWIF